MDISPRERLAYGGAGIDTLAVPIMFYFPEYGVFVAVPMFIIGTVLLVIAVFPVTLVGWKLFIYGFTPLQKAAKKTYEVTRNKTPGNWAETAFFSRPGDPLGWFAHALLGSTQEKGIQLFGCKPQLDILDPISYREYKSYYLIVDDGGAALVDKFKHNFVIYDRLHVRKRDLKKQIEFIASWDMPNGYNDKQGELAFDLFAEQDRLEGEIKELELMKAQTHTEVA